MSYYLVTREGHEWESMVLEGTGERKDGYVRVGFEDTFDWVLEADLTVITRDDYFTILNESAYGDTDRLLAVYAALADGTY